MCKIMEEMRNEALKEGIEAGKKEGKKEGIKEGIKEGKKEGIKEGALNTVKRMISDGTLSLEKIAELAGVSYEEVVAVAKDK